MRAIKIKCPTCEGELEYSEKFPFRPFCSERCKLIDLGEWASENRKIQGNSIYDDILSKDLDEDGNY